MDASNDSARCRLAFFTSTMGFFPRQRTKTRNPRRSSPIRLQNPPLTLRGEHSDGVRSLKFAREQISRGGLTLVVVVVVVVVVFFAVATPSIHPSD